MSTPTYLLVDGENIDATLGMSVLGRRPEPEERPRWDRVLSFCDELASAGDEGVETTALFFLNATSGHMPMGFVQALMAMEYRPLPLAGSDDGDYIPQVERLLDAGAYVGVLCFHEFLNAQLAGLEAHGLVVHDLEEDVNAFTSPLPRVRIISLEEFDPLNFI